LIWLRNSAISWKVPGSRPDEVIEFVSVYLSLLIHYAKSPKIASSRPDEVIFFSSIYLILPAALGPGHVI
jgi:hypothetical protein